VLQAFRVDLMAAQAEVGAITVDLTSMGFALTPVRVLEVLLWIKVAERG
jgi:hypothetical protein